MKRGNLQQLIEDALRLHPDARNSDIKLTHIIWWKVKPEAFFTNGKNEWCIAVKEMYDLPTHESVKRYRAKLNSEGKYLPTNPDVAKKRNLLIDDWREDLGYRRSDTLT